MSIYCVIIPLNLRKKEPTPAKLSDFLNQQLVMPTLILEQIMVSVTIDLGQQE